MQLKTITILLLTIGRYLNFELTLRQYITSEKKQEIFYKLQQIQMDAFNNKLLPIRKINTKRMNKGSPNDKFKIHQFALESFKEIYDQGSLAYVATVCLGKQCGVKCNEKKKTSVGKLKKNNSGLGKQVVQGTKKQKTSNVLHHRLKQKMFGQQSYTNISKIQNKVMIKSIITKTQSKIANIGLVKFQNRLQTKAKAKANTKTQTQTYNKAGNYNEQKSGQVNDICSYRSNRPGLQPNEFRVLLDTGSTNVFLVGNQCKSQVCDNHQKYDERWQQQQWNTADIQKIGYISGDTVGKIIYDDLFIGGIDINKQPLFIGSQVSLPIFEGSQWDGVMGLGYWYDPNQKAPAQEKSIIDNIIEEDLVKKKLFTYYIPGENVAKASFGEVVDELKDKLDNQDVVQWSNIEDIDIESQWQVKVYDIRLEKSHKGKAISMMRFSRTNSPQKNRMLAKKIQFQHKMSTFMRKQTEFNKHPCAEKGCNLLVDTGTYLNYVPTQWFEKFFPKDMFKVDDQLCNSFDQFPDIVMKFKHSNSSKFYELRMKGNQYMDRIGGKEYMCNPSFCPDTTEDNLITLGQVFLKNYYTIFDFGDTKKIGFYPIEALNRFKKKQ